MKLTTRPLDAATWPDLEKLFQARGCSVARSCWCMYYRKTGGSQWGDKPWSDIKESNRQQLKALAERGGPIGLIGYRGDEPVGWISFGPREDFPRLANSKIMGAVDDQPVWSVVCFVVPSEFRKQGVARELLGAAVAWCRRRKVRLLEAYPVDKPKRAADSSMWFGAKSMFDAAGFEEIARRKPDRPVVRLKVI